MPPTCLPWGFVFREEAQTSGEVRPEVGMGWSPGRALSARLDCTEVPGQDEQSPRGWGIQGPDDASIPEQRSGGCTLSMQARCYPWGCTRDHAIPGHSPPLHLGLSSKCGHGLPPSAEDWWWYRGTGSR